MNPGGFGFPGRRGSGVADAVRFGASQVLASLQRLTALGNIGAVGYADAQSLLPTQRQQALGNIGGLSYADAQTLGGADIKRVGDNLALADILGQNRIINGGMQIWQRGTLSTADGYVACDRWTNFRNGGTVTQSQQSFALGDVIASGITPRFFLRQTVSGQSLPAHYAITEQPIEDVRSYSGQTVTLSFWARRSSGSGNMAVEFRQYFGTGGSPSATITGIGVTTITLTASWARYTATTSIPSISARTLGTNNDHFLGVGFWTSGGSDFNARNNSLGLQAIGVDIWGVMINRGSTALEYIERPLSVEEMLCNRYFVRRFATCRFNASGANVFTEAPIYFPVPMRATPTVSNIVAGSRTNVNAGATNIFASNNQIGRMMLVSAASGDCSTFAESADFSAEL